MSAFYRRIPPSVSGDTETRRDTETLHGVVFAELVAYIESLREHPHTASVFSVASLCHLCSSRLDQLGLQGETVHSTRLREKIAVLDLDQANQGRDVIPVLFF